VLLIHVMRRVIRYGTVSLIDESGKRHIAAKLDIKPGMTVLDIGPGWASTLATDFYKVALRK